jgi:hypothetical protein
MVQARSLVDPSSVAADEALRRLAIEELKIPAVEGSEFQIRNET